MVSAVLGVVGTQCLEGNRRVLQLDSLLGHGAQGTGIPHVLSGEGPS